MGFLDKLKAAAKFVTGGGAKVILEVDNPCIGQPMTVKIQAAISDADMKIQRVYLQIRATEQVTIPRVKVAKEEDGTIVSVEEAVSEEVQTFNQETNVTGPLTLSAKQIYNWQTEVTLPVGLSPSYYGRNANHRYYFLAALDAPGTDPGSGWVEVRI